MTNNMLLHRCFHSWHPFALNIEIIESTAAVHVTNFSIQSIKDIVKRIQMI